MTEPIKSGDECLVISGATQSRSPLNLGRRVTVLSLQGEHSRFGRIWRCVSTDGKPLDRIMGCYADDSLPTNTADFAAAWLQKATGLPPTTQSNKKEIVDALFIRAAATNSAHSDSLHEIAEVIEEGMPTLESIAGDYK